MIESQLINRNVFSRKWGAVANWLGRPVGLGYSPQSPRVFALFAYNHPECLSRRNRPKAIETSKLVEPQLVRPRSPME